MKIIGKIKEKSLHLRDSNPITLAFFGDSVTQGCFDLYRTSENSAETYFDAEHAYHTQLRKIFGMLYPNVPLNLINAGISGDSAADGLKRLERDVLRASPDLCVVCFGLNDSVKQDEQALTRYCDAMREIFTALGEAEIETILLTPNMMCTDVSCHIQDDLIRGIAESAAQIQNSGRLELFLGEAQKIARKMNIPICDCYAKWKHLYEGGVNICELLANRINHPTPEMNWLFAVSLIETMFCEK